MGVTGLWQLVDPAGKPIALETLDNKILAVDISIWLNQAIRGYREGASGGGGGGVAAQAHLLTLFNRLCKLLFYGIRPVFVFDGRAPELKRQTLSRRRSTQKQAVRRAQQTRLRLIENHLRSQQVSQKIRRETQAVGEVLKDGQEGLSRLLSRRRRDHDKDKDKDLFELPPKPEEADDADADSEEEEEARRRGQLMAGLDIDRVTDIHTVDVDDDKFRSLPGNLQAEALMELREKRKQNSWAKMHEMPREAGSFSGFQMERLLKRSAMHRRLDDVGKELAAETTLELDRKLFVGDREGMRRERKMLAEAAAAATTADGGDRIIQGKDFLYIGKVDSAGRGKTGDPEAGPSTSQSRKDLDDDEDKSELISILAAQDGLTQEEILAIAAADGGGEDPKLASQADSDAADVLVMEPTTTTSCRSGGLAAATAPLEWEGASKLPASVDLSSDEDDGEEEAKTADSSSKTSSSAPATGIEITIPLPAAKVGVMSSSDDDEEEDDLFADVFRDAQSHDALDKILSAKAPGVGAGASVTSGNVRKEEVSFAAFASTMAAAAATTDREKTKSRTNSLPSPESEENEARGDDSIIALVEQARSQYPKGRDMFAAITKKSRKEMVEEKRADSSKEEDANLVKGLANTMKNSEHLYLKVCSKYAQPESGSEPKPADVPTAEQARRRKLAKEAEQKLEQEHDTIVREMRESEKEKRLLQLTRARSVAEAIPSDPESKKKMVASEERAALADMGVAAEEQEKYAKDLLAKEGLREEEEEEDREPAVVYGSSAPGFVRSKKSAGVVEVDKEDAEDVEKEEGVFDKLDVSVEDDDDEATTLSTEELRRMQERLSLDEQRLVAERSRQDRQAATITDQMYADCQELLQLFGIPWIVAPSEAEAQCAFLDVNGLSNGTITDDSDVWVFGGQNVYKNFFNQDKYCEHFTAADIARHFGLSREKMIQLAMLTGSDYTEGVASVGPVTAMEVIAEFGDKRKGQAAAASAASGHDQLQPLRRLKDWWTAQQSKAPPPPGSKIREKLKKLQLPENFPNPLVCDAYLNPVVDNSGERFSWAIPNFVEASDFAQERFGWTRKKVDEMIKPVIKRLASRHQSQANRQQRIDNYFQSERVQLPVKGLLQTSRRVQVAIDKVLGKNDDDKVDDVDKVDKTKKSAAKTAKKPAAVTTSSPSKSDTSKSAATPATTPTAAKSRKKAAAPGGRPAKGHLLPDRQLTGTAALVAAVSKRSKKVAKNDASTPSTSAGASRAGAPAAPVANTPAAPARTDSKVEAKRKAIEIYQKSLSSKAKKRKGTYQVPKRIVVEQHNLSESDSD